MTQVSNKKRILIFSTAYLPFVGGAEIAVKEITDRLPQYEFVMVTAKIKKDLPDVENVGNIQVHRIGTGSSWDKIRLVVDGPRLAATLGKFSGVWSIMASYAGFAALRYKKQHSSVRYLLTLQEGDSRFDIYKHVWWCWPYFKQIFTRADRIQAISNYLADWARDMGAKCPIDVVPNGVEIKNIEKEHKSTDVKRVITVSRLVKKNGLEFLIKAMKYVNDGYNQPAVLKIVGDGKLKRELNILAKKTGLEDRFAFFGTVSNKEVYERLRQADVFVRPSLSEGLGNAFLEAMAMGVPVVATKVGGIPDFLIDGENGLFCTHDPKDVADKILRILKDPVLAEKLRINARSMIEEKYSWDLIANMQMKKIFESL